MSDYKVLGQLMPSTLTTEILYFPADNVDTVVTSLVVCNPTASAATYRIYCNNDSRVFSSANALYWDVSLAAGATDTVTTRMCFNNPSGGIGVEASVVDTIVFTLFGVES